MFSVGGILSVVVVLIPPEDDDTSLVVMFKNIVVSGGVVVETPGIVALNAFMFLLERRLLSNKNTNAFNAFFKKWLGKGRGK